MRCICHQLSLIALLSLSKSKAAPGSGTLSGSQEDQKLLLEQQHREREKRRNRLKAKLRRQCEMKKGKNGKLKLLVPDFVHEMWKNGNKDELAETFAECGFDTVS